jgi:putative transposase
MDFKYDPKIHDRQSLRLKRYDYSQEGAYFVTICTRHKACHFGHIENDEMMLNGAGK